MCDRSVKTKWRYSTSYERSGGEVKRSSVRSKSESATQWRYVSVREDSRRRTVSEGTSKPVGMSRSDGTEAKDRLASLYRQRLVLKKVLSQLNSAEQIDSQTSDGLSRAYMADFHFFSSSLYRQSTPRRSRSQSESRGSRPQTDNLRLTARGPTDLDNATTFQDRNLNNRGPKGEEHSYQSGEVRGRSECCESPTLHLQHHLLSPTSPNNNHPNPLQSPVDNWVYRQPCGLQPHFRSNRSPPSQHMQPLLPKPTQSPNKLLSVSCSSRSRGIPPTTSTSLLSSPGENLQPQFRHTSHTHSTGGTSGGDAEGAVRSAIHRLQQSTVAPSSCFSNSNLTMASCNGFSNGPMETTVGGSGASQHEAYMYSSEEDSGGLSLSSQDNSRDSSVESLGFEPCLISLEERLLKTSPIWYLPDLHRLGAVHLLQAQEVGSFIVRESSKPNTLAITVRLPADKGPHVEHYLIESHQTENKNILSPSDVTADLSSHSAATDSGNKSATCSPIGDLKSPFSEGRSPDARSHHLLNTINSRSSSSSSSCSSGSLSYSLEASANRFDSPTALITHYSTVCDELPVTLQLPKKLREARSRKELQSLALLGQEYWRTAGAITNTSPPIEKLLPQDNSHCVTTSQTHDSQVITFSSFGKQVNSSSTNSLFSPSLHPEQSLQSILTSAEALHGGNLFTPGDRSSLHLNLAPLDEILKDPPTFSSFRGSSQQGTPITPLRPSTRVSPPHVPLLTHSVAKTPSFSDQSTSNSLSTFSSRCNNTSPPLPPPRWAKLSVSTPTSTVTTTLTIPINHVNEVVIPVQDYSNNKENSNPKDNIPSLSNRHREKLELQIKAASMTSPQSTPCTPCNPTTPLSTPMSEEGGENRVKLRRGHRDKRRLSNHYHDVNIIDYPHCYRSSLADKISDYEDVWSSPPRELPTDSDAKDYPSPKKMSKKTSSYKANSDISKSMGDLSDVSQSHSVIYNDKVNEINEGAVTPSVMSSPFRNTNSPFYVEPADCLMEAEKKRNPKKHNSQLSRKIVNRYSDSNIQWKSRQSKNIKTLIQSGQASPFSSSLENLLQCYNEEDSEDSIIVRPRRNKINRNIRNLRVKPVLPPRVSSGDILEDNNNGEDSSSSPVPWRVDNSWMYKSCEDNLKAAGHSGSPSADARFPVDNNNSDSDRLTESTDRTVIDLISEKLPDLPIAETQSIALSSITKLSEYDNVAIRNSNNNRLTANNSRRGSKLLSPVGGRISSSVSDSGTEFSEPWDSRKWDTILQTDDESSIEPISLSGTPARPRLENWERRLGSVQTGESGAGSDEDTSSLISGILPLVNDKHIDSSLRSKILSPQLLALRHRKDAESGSSIHQYSLQLGSDQTSMFAQNIQQFIDCTLDSNEKDPEVVVRNVRQFMSGMKNYLVTSGEKQFEDIVRHERGNLKSTEFLNLDAILEDVLVRLVLRKLWHHITALYVNAYTTNESIQKLANNMTFARSLKPESLGIRNGLSPPTGLALEETKKLLAKMQRVYAPREKLELLLTTVTIIYHSLSSSSLPLSLEADDLVPQLSYLLSHCGFFSAEIEADYMSGLLLHSSTCGEARYYLNAFHSAIHTLKNLAPTPDSTPGNSLDAMNSEGSNLLHDAATLKIVVPDENNGSIVTRTLPVKPSTTSREICKMMAHKMRVTNPQDYGLYKLVDGTESVLSDTECPHSIRNILSGKGLHCIIAFKRTDAKIAWPMARQ